MINETKDLYQKNDYFYNRFILRPSPSSLVRGGSPVFWKESHCKKGLFSGWV